MNLNVSSPLSIYASLLPHFVKQHILFKEVLVNLAPSKSPALLREGETKGGGGGTKERKMPSYV